MRPIERIQERITFLQTQIESLDHYLPETYQYLLEEMDIQQRTLMELKIQTYYRMQIDEQQDQATDTRDSWKD
jgi:hypothetical protein